MSLSSCVLPYLFFSLVSMESLVYLEVSLESQEVSRVFHGCINGVSRVFQRYFKEVSRILNCLFFDSLFQRCFKKVKKCSKKVSRMF